MTVCLEAFAVHDAGARLIVLLLADPHLLEGGQRGKDGATDPYGVLSLWGSDDLDLHRGWGKGCDFLLHPVGDAGVHGGATGQHGVGVKILTDVHVALHDAVVCGFVDSSALHSQEGWLEERLWASETLVANGDDLTVRELVALLQRRAGGSGLHLLLKVKGDVAQLLLDVTNDFTLSCKDEKISNLIMR